jgi:hypothetical protein
MSENVNYNFPVGYLDLHEQENINFQLNHCYKCFCIISITTDQHIGIKYDKSD